MIIFIYTVDKETIKYPLNPPYKVMKKNVFYLQIEVNANKGKLNINMSTLRDNLCNLNRV